MKKINYPVLTIILLIFINGCTGYKPIFGSANFDFKIAEYSIEDDKILGNKIYSKLFRLSKSVKDNQNTKNIILTISVSKDKNATSKDNKGKILEYKITLNTKVTVVDFITGDKILSQNFSLSSTYKVQDQYYTTIQKENETINNLIDNTYQDLLIKLSQNIITK